MPDWLIGDQSQWFWQMLEAVAVIVSLALIVRQLRLAHAASMLDTLHRMDERWSAVEMTTAKSAVCDAYLANGSGEDIALGPTHKAVLGFFEDVGIYCKRGVLDAEVIWDAYSQDVVFFWALLLPRVEEFRANSQDDTWFEHAEWLCAQMHQHSKRRGVPVKPLPKSMLRSLAEMHATKRPLPRRADPKRDEPGSGGIETQLR